MSKCVLKEFGLSPAEAKNILVNKPDVDGELFWHRAIGLYYIAGKRKNALVFCEAIKEWRSSTRYNTELSDVSTFIPVLAIERRLQGVSA